MIQPELSNQLQVGDTIEIEPHGYVRYVDYLGSDQRIVEAARVSYLGKSKGEEADKKLLKYLFLNRHTSPFEQCNITFDIKMPIFVMRQFVRHRTFRLNEWSGRYSELKDEFYLPTHWRLPDIKNKQGSKSSFFQGHVACTAICKQAYENAYKAYQDLLSAGVAKEMARFVLPVGIYTVIYVNCDLHNLMHFLRLRLDAHAQKEIRDIAQCMKAIAEKLFPWTFELFDNYNLVMMNMDTGPMS